MLRFAVLLLAALAAHASAHVGLGHGTGWTRSRQGRRARSIAQRIRGGKFNLFGDKGDDDNNALEADLEAATDSLFGEPDGDDSAPGNGSTYPALSTEEIYGLLRGVPVFTVTDDEGKALIIINGDGARAVNYFMDPTTAMMVKDHLEANATEKKLQVRGRALIEAVDLKKESKKAIAEDGATAFPHVNIYASPRELSMASQLEKNATMESRLGLDQDAIPVFTCPSMVIAPEGEEPLRPWFFSLQHLMETLKKAAGDSDDAAADTVVHMSSLDGLMRLMEKESELNWRRTLFLPSPVASAAISQGQPTDGDGEDGGSPPPGGKK